MFPADLRHLQKQLHTGHVTERVATAHGAIENLHTCTYSQFELMLMSSIDIDKRSG